MKCKECKFKCHRDCEPKVPPSCSLPDDLLELYYKQITKEGSPILPSRMAPFTPGGGVMHPMGHGGIPGQEYNLSGNAPKHINAYPDSSSNTSSCNSSTPSSPAVMVTTHATPPHSAASVYQSRGGTKFTFPDPPIKLNFQDMANMPQAPPKVTSPNPIIDSVKSYDSDKTLSGEIY